VTEGHLVCKKPVPFMSKGPILERVEEEVRVPGYWRFTWKASVETELVVWSVSLCMSVVGVWVLQI